MKRYTRLGEQSFTTNIKNIGDDNQDLICVGYRRSLSKLCFFALFSIITCGFLLLLRRWRPRWTIGLQYSKCSLDICDLVLLSNNTDDYFVCEIWRLPVDKIPEDFIQFSKPAQSSSVIDKISIPSQRSTLLINRQFSSKTSSLRCFTFRYDVYVWNAILRTFFRLNGVQIGAKCGEILARNRGWNVVEQDKRRKLYGENSIDVEVKSYWSLLINEVLNPFYVFQIASLTLWAIDDYFIYAGCILFISLISIGIELYETRKQAETLRDTVASANNTMVAVRRRDGGFETISSKLLVPGDIIIIPPEGCLMSCDALLMNGSCIVNESMLTGESVPVTKCAVSKSEEAEILSYEHHKKHILFCGTSIIQTRFYSGNKVSALILRTGFSTAKGDLVKDILFPKSVRFKFYRDAMIFIGFLALIALTGTCYSLYLYIKRGADLQKIIIRSLDIITIVVPPALPAAMTVGIWYAQRRLKKKEIFCISPPRINVCGKLNMICFDKTGTLTEEGLDFQGVLPVQDGVFGDLIEDPSAMTYSPVIACMSSCHSLTMINERIAGDPLDIVMFEATKWELTEPTSNESAQYDVIAPTIVRPLPIDGQQTIDDDLFTIPEEENDSEGIQMQTFLVKPGRKLSGSIINADDSEPLEIGILRQFPFSSTLQRSAVVVRRLGAKSMELFVKGAPEKIIGLCKQSFVPSSFHEVLENQTRRGHRVIAMAYKPLDRKLLWHHLQRMRRETLENDLEFIGLLILQNKLKPQSTPVIQELHRAQILTIMATGDNLLTALSVACESELIAKNQNLQIINVQQNVAEGQLPFLELQSYSVATGGQEPMVDKHGFDLSSMNTVIGGNVKFALTGSSFCYLKENFPDLFEKVVLNGIVFARMSPHNKSVLVQTYQELGFIVGMCGDGANDCGALKVAHAGISLSNSEASVAAPFTSRVQTIECVPAIIREGRCALVTSFGVFKYMAIYSLIQFISVLILYTLKTQLGDYMFLFIDLFIITSVAFLMGRNEPAEKLFPRRPSGSLLSVQVVISLTVHLILLVSFQVIAVQYVFHRPWYKAKNPKPNEDIYVSWETTTIFFITCYQYLIMAFVFAHGPPYRQPFYKNYWFLFVLIFLTTMVTLLIIFPSSIVHRWLDLEPVGFDLWRYKLTLILMALVNLIVCTCFEEFVVSNQLLRNCKKLCCKKRSKARYKSFSNSIYDEP